MEDSFRLVAIETEFGIGLDESFQPAGQIGSSSDAEEETSFPQ